MKYPCRWCGELVDEENAIYYSISEGYYHEECWPKAREERRKSALQLTVVGLVAIIVAGIWVAGVIWGWW